MLSGANNSVEERKFNEGNNFKIRQWVKNIDINKICKCSHCLMGKSNMRVDIHYIN